VDSLLSSFDPLALAPSLIAVAVGVLVWRRHRNDRRARLFLALACSELAFSVPSMLLAFGFLPATDAMAAVINGLGMTIGIIAAAVFFHFGMAFPHARPWLRRDWMRAIYGAAVLVGVLPLVLSIVAPGSRVISETITGGVVLIVGPVALAGAVIGCVAMFRSYREMAAGERLTYRAPVLGVFFGMIAGVAIDLTLGLFAAFDDRYLRWAGDVLSTAASLLLPLFFFIAAIKYRLLERHAQDYVSKN
jgi:hypothetical protein